MENRSKRKDQWIEISGTLIGPGTYNVSNLKSKESFNYGSVPFGSHSNHQQLSKTRIIHQINQNPGPG